MYAIVRHGGHQYRVAPGERLLVDRLPDEVGAVVELQPVLFVGGEDGKSDAADGARVAAVVVSHRRGPKLRVFKYKPKKRRRTTHGFRSDLTELRVEKLLAKGEKAPARAAAKAPEAAAPAHAVKPAVAAKKPAEAKPKAEVKPKTAGKPTASGKKSS